MSNPEQATDQPLLVDTRGAVCRLTLNRPEMRNPLSPDMIDALEGAVRAASVDPKVRVIVIQAAGSAFCAGGNLKKVDERAQSELDANGNDPIALNNRRYGKFLEALQACPKITVAVAQGAAMGGGAGMVCAVDIAIGVRNAKFGLPETLIGLAPAQILPFVAGRIGMQAARRLCLTGERINGDEAHRIGMLDYVVEDATALEAKVAEVIAAARNAAPGATVATKRMLREVNGLREWFERDRSTFLDGASLVLAAQMRTEAVEGVAASRDKRPAKWSLEA